MIVISGGREQKQPVWEITGAEFTNQGVHTADGISIRFPRVTRIRHDKNWSTATTLNELRELFRKKPESLDFNLILGTSTDVKGSPRKKLSNSDKSPKKLKMRRISPIKSPAIPEIKKDSSKVTESFEKRIKDESSEESDSIADFQSEKKRLKIMKREIEEETNDPLLIRVEKESEEEQETADRDVLDIPRKKLFNSDKSPKKLKNMRSLLDEPSTSFQIKEESLDISEIKEKPSSVAEEYFKKQGRKDKRNEKSDEIAHVQSERKKLKAMKEETQNPLPIKVRKQSEEEKEQERKDHYVNRFTDRMDAEEFSEDSGDAGAFDLDVEDNVSNDVLNKIYVFSKHISLFDRFLLNFIFIFIIENFII